MQLDDMCRQLQSSEVARAIIPCARYGSIAHMTRNCGLFMMLGGGHRYNDWRNLSDDHYAYENNQSQ